MSDNAASSALQTLIAKDAIRDVLLKYCHGMDRRDPDVLDSVFWPGSPLEYGMYQGTGPEFNAFVLPWFKTMNMPLTVHLIGNSLIRLSGDEAFAETYFQAFHRAPNDNGVERDVFVAGRYHDVFACRSGEWRIARRKLIFDWFRDLGDSGNWETGTFGIRHGTGHIGDGEEHRWDEFRSLLLADRNGDQR